MKSNFNDCLNRVLKDEGGYTNDLADSGGATNFGITIQDYRLYINPKGTPLDVKGMSLDDAKRIYRTKYWDALDCDSLSSGVDYTVFDYGVNSGLQRPKKALQQFKSLTGTSLIDAINNERTAFLEALAARRPKDQKFLKGWLSRVARVRSYSKSLASNKAGPIAGVAVIGTGLTSSQYFHQHQSAIIVGALILGLVVGAAIYIIRQRNV